MLIDCRCASSQVQRTPGFLSLSDVALRRFQGAGWFESMDALKGFWQFPFGKRKSRNLFSLVSIHREDPFKEIRIALTPSNPE